MGRCGIDRVRGMTSIAKLLMQGHSQVVLLPEGIHFEGTEVRISRVGDKVVLEPIDKPPLDAPVRPDPRIFFDE
jgi:virulence-associated protein VagC